MIFHDCLDDYLTACLLILSIDERSYVEKGLISVPWHLLSLTSHLSGMQDVDGSILKLNCYSCTLLQSHNHSSHSYSVSPFHSSFTSADIYLDTLSVYLGFIIPRFRREPRDDIIDRHSLLSSRDTLMIESVSVEYWISVVSIVSMAWISRLDITR